MRYVFKNIFFVILFAVIDLCGYVLFFFIRLIRQKRPSEAKRILIIRLDHLGDVLYSSSIAKTLKDSYEEAKIDFLAASWSQELLANNPYLNKIIVYDAPWFDRKNNKLFSLKSFLALAAYLRKNNYDLGLDLRGDFRHILLMYLAGIKFRAGYGITGGGFLLQVNPPYKRDASALEHNLDLVRGLGIEAAGAVPEIYTTASDQDKLAGLLENSRISDRDFVAVIHPHAGYPAKDWSDDRFSRLIDVIFEKFQAKIILIGSKSDIETNNRIIAASHAGALNFAGDTSIQVLFLLLKRANLFIGVDSGPSHIAGVAGLPSVILYSATNNTQEWAPPGSKVSIITRDVTCKGCEKEYCGENICMKLISVADVVEEAEKAVKR